MLPLRPLSCWSCLTKGLTCQGKLQQYHSGLHASDAEHFKPLNTLKSVAVRNMRSTG